MFLSKEPKVVDNGKIQYACELEIIHKYRSFSDGITFSEFKLEYDKYEGDHKPSFICSLVFMNYMIFEFHVYNIFHTDDNEE